MGDNLSKKLNELKDLLKSKSLKRALENARGKTIIRRRSGQSTKVEAPPPAEVEAKKKQKDVESKLRADKTYRDAALRSNKANASSKKAKAKLTAQQNKGYDEAVQDETKGIPETVGTKKRTDKYINQMSRRKEAGTKKLIQRQEKLGKGMRNAGLGGAGSVKAGAVLPSINNKLTKPGHNSLATSVGIPNVAPKSEKNPLKSAEQTQNKDIKDLKMKEAQTALKAKAPEMIKFEKNGQWSLRKDSADPKLAPKDRRVKELQRQIDAGTYKPDASKIADAMLKKPESQKIVKFEKNGQWSLVEKSGYKGYSEADNARRKAKNLTTETGVKNMPRIKQYGNSAKVQAAREAAKMKAKSKKNPVKIMTGDEIPQELRDKYEAKGKSQD